MFQAKNSEEKIAQKVMLPLAERMVKKFIDEGKIEAEQEIQLFLMILEMQVTIFLNCLNIQDIFSKQKFIMIPFCWNVMKLTERQCKIIFKQDLAV